MEPQKDPARSQSDQSAADWNKEQSAQTSANENPTPGAVTGPDMSQAAPPAPAEVTVGGPDMPSIAQETGAQTPATSSVLPDQHTPVSGSDAQAVSPSDDVAPPSSAVHTPPQTDTTPAPSDATPSSTTLPPEPSVHHPLSVTILLGGLAVLIVLVLAIFVLPMLF